MNTAFMLKRSRTRQVPGQSIVLIALIIVILVSFTGLSVDVGNAYAQQRRMQQAANAGALAGMNAVTLGQTNAEVQQEIRRALAANGVNYNDTARYSYTTWYLLRGQTSERLISSFSPTANTANIERVVVKLRENVGTYFARVVGRAALPAVANGYACLGSYNLGVYPIGLPLTLTPTSDNPHRKFLGWDVATHTGSGEIQPGSAGWSNEWHTATTSPLRRREIVRIPVSNGITDLPGVHIAWLTWRSGESSSNAALNASLRYPGNLGQTSFVEVLTPPNGSINGPRPGEMEIRDWLDGSTGARANATVDDEAPLTQHVIRGDIMVLMMYSETGTYTSGGGGGNGSRAFRVAKMGGFRLIDAVLQGSDKFLAFEYMGQVGGAAGQCSAGPHNIGPNVIPTAAAIRANVTGTVHYDRLTATVNAVGSRTSDVVIVQSVAQNMDLNMNGGTTSPLRIHNVRDGLINLANSFHVADLLGRMALVTYGRSNGGNPPSYTATNSGWYSGVGNNGFDVVPPYHAQSFQRQIENVVNDARAGNQEAGYAGLRNANTLFSTARSGANRVVVMVVDNVMNVCGYASSACGADRTTAQFNGGFNNWTNADAQLNHQWALWQTQELADTMHANGVQIFVIALTRPSQSASGWFDTRGLRDIASGPGFYYEATDSTQLSAAFTQIGNVISAGPSATMHSTESRCNPRSQVIPMANVQVALFYPDGRQAYAEATTDANGTFTIPNVNRGSYTLGLRSSSGEGPPELYGHFYTRVFNFNNRAEWGGTTGGIMPINITTSTAVTTKLLVRAPEDNHGFASHTDAGENGCRPYVP